MAYIELYSDEILDTVSLGKTSAEFNPNQGDYVKVEVINTDDSENIVVNTFYSNRLLLKNVNTNNFYIGDYHFHPENGFMVGKEHTTEEHSKLLPIPVGTTEPQLLSDFNPNLEYKKQMNVYYDDNNKIYIKPTEILEKVNAVKAKYKLKIYFLKSIKSTISRFLKSQQNNLIENGNFFAGLEATQAGDLDSSIGHNRFVMLPNPSLGRFVLEQNGAGDNDYNMTVTGVEPNSNYILSTWVGFNNQFDSNYYDILCTFDNASSEALENNSQELLNQNLSPNNNVSFNLRGTYHQGWPHTIIRVNQALVTDFYVDGPNVPDTGYQDYQFNLPSLLNDTAQFDENSQIEISVTFDNDSWGGAGGESDKNLYWRNFTAPNGRKYFINQSGTDGLFFDESYQQAVPNTSVLYYTPTGALRVGNDFAGEFNWGMYWNGTVTITMRAGDFFDLTPAPPPVEQTQGLVLTPSSPNYNTDNFSSYKITQNNTEIDRNLQVVTVGDIVWYKRYKLVSTTAEADLGYMNIHLGKNNQLDFINSSTLGRRYFTDLRFEKIDNLHTALGDYLNNLTMG